MSPSGPTRRNSRPPVRSQIDGFPARIIELRLRPHGIVACVKLPRAGKLDRRITQFHVDDWVYRCDSVLLWRLHYGGSVDPQR